MSKWYEDYLSSDEWQIRRLKRMLSCETCNFPQSIKCEHLDCGLFVPLKAIEVHHLTYDRLGSELHDDLAVYCSSCHGASHGFPRAVWWKAAKAQGIKHVTEEFLRRHRRVKLIGEVMYDCLQFAPRAQMQFLLDNIKAGLELDARKYPPANAV